MELNPSFKLSILVSKNKSKMPSSKVAYNYNRLKHEHARERD